MDNRGSGNILGQNSGSGSKFMYSICIHNIVLNRPQSQVLFGTALSQVDRGSGQR